MELTVLKCTGRHAMGQYSMIAMGFEWIYGYKPLSLRLVRGSVDLIGHSPALTVCVSKDNPLSQIDMGQLAAIFEHRPASGRSPIVAWGRMTAICETLGIVDHCGFSPASERPSRPPASTSLRETTRSVATAMSTSTAVPVGR
jgi:hypothetical protein